MLRGWGMRSATGGSRDFLLPCIAAEPTLQWPRERTQRRRMLARASHVSSAWEEKFDNDPKSIKSMSSSCVQDAENDSMPMLVKRAVSDDTLHVRAGPEEKESDLEQQQAHQACGALSADLRIAEAEKAKTVGNGFVKIGDLAEAFKNYKFAAEMVDPFLETRANEVSEDIRERAATVSLALRLNMAQAYLKSGDWDTAMEYANLVLERDPDNHKALYRRAVAAMHLGTEAWLKQSCEDLERVVKMKPTVEVKDQLNCVKERLHEVHEQEKQQVSLAMSETIVTSRCNADARSLAEEAMVEPISFPVMSTEPQACQNQEVSAELHPAANSRSRFDDGSIMHDLVAPELRSGWQPCAQGLLDYLTPSESTFSTSQLAELIKQMEDPAELGLVAPSRTVVADGRAMNESEILEQMLTNVIHRAVDFGKSTHSESCAFQAVQPVKDVKVSAELESIASSKCDLVALTVTSSAEDPDPHCGQQGCFQSSPEDFNFSNSSFMVRAGVQNVEESASNPRSDVHADSVENDWRDPRHHRTLQAAAENAEAALELESAASTGTEVHAESTEIDSTDPEHNCRFQVADGNAEVSSELESATTTRNEVYAESIGNVSTNPERNCGFQAASEDAGASSELESVANGRNEVHAESIETDSTDSEQTCRFQAAAANAYASLELESAAYTRNEVHAESCVDQPAVFAQSSEQQETQRVRSARSSTGTVTHTCLCQISEQQLAVGQQSAPAWQSCSCDRALAAEDAWIQAVIALRPLEDDIEDEFDLLELRQLMSEATDSTARFEVRETGSQPILVTAPHSMYLLRDGHEAHFVEEKTADIGHRIATELSGTSLSWAQNEQRRSYLLASLGKRRGSDAGILLDPRNRDPNYLTTAEVESNVWFQEMLSLSMHWREQFGENSPSLHVDVHGCRNPPESPAHLTVGLGAMCLHAHEKGPEALEYVKVFGEALKTELTSALAGLRLEPQARLVHVAMLSSYADAKQFSGACLQNSKRLTQTQQAVRLAKFTHSVQLEMSKGLRASLSKTRRKAIPRLAKSLRAAWRRAQPCACEK